MSIQAIDWVAHHAQATPNKTAMVELAGQRRFSYAQMHERVGRVSAMLRGKGIKKGDRVGFLTLNSSDTLEIIFGCWRLGAVCLAINFRLTPPEIAYILENADCSLVVVDTPFMPIAQALEGKTPVKDWIHTDGMGGESDYETALARVDPILTYEPQTLDDQCLLMYSSGTTGTPKGVIITHGMMYFSASGGSGPGENTRNSVSLSNMPLFHIGGLNVSGTPAIWIGGTTVIMRMFDPEATLDAINAPELGITSLFMVPAAYNALKAHPKSESTDFSRITTALCGAETVPTALVNYWLNRGVIIQEGYGMTETAAAGCMLAKNDIPAKIGSAGKALMHSQIGIFDESFVDGWFKSGDIGRKDADGFIYIEDRIKDMYISGGENVYPAEIENLLYQMDSITEVAVIGVPDERFGETGCVVAVVKPGKSLTLEDINDHICDKLAKFKCPNYLHLVEALPRNATGKVLKFELRKTIPKTLGL